MIEDKIKIVEDILKNKKIAIAFSGGADSTLISYIAKKVASEVLLITVNNHLMPSDFLSGSKKIASTLKLPQEIIDMNFYKNDEFIENKPNRCYLCRDLMYSEIIKLANSRGFKTIIDGTNISDLLDDRPGILINYKNNIESPFVKGGLESFEIHKYLDINDIKYLKSSTCLATRINTNLTKEKIQRIQKSEDFIKNHTDCEIVKVREKENISICEVDKISPLLDENKLNLIDNQLKSYGFKKVCLNLSPIEEKGKFFLDYDEENNCFKYQLPYNINLSKTQKIFENSKLNNNYIKTGNIHIFDDGKIIGNGFKNKKEAKKEFLKILPNLRREI
ncbi:7-cyano-7-deazaguanine synthase [Methanobrevibacter sp. OttesenSCG-928-I08]|nr:7-cyano-7-deazaguanine synthase [Methanobrevibacter sp. OttesenSCG-928-I08]